MSSPTACLGCVDDAEDTKKNRRRYVGGYYAGDKGNLAKRLADMSIHLKSEYKFVACYDCECALSPHEDCVPNDVNIHGAAQSSVTSKHNCVSISVATNVPGFDSVCFIDEDVSVLVEQFVRRIGDIQQEASKLMRVQCSSVIKQLEDDICFKQNCVTDNKIYEAEVKYLTKLLNQMTVYTDELPVIGYNSSNYDLLVLREELFPRLHLQEHGSFIIKKSNSYIALSNGKFRFLDAMLYNAAGTSYAQFLTAYGTGVKKGFFPYEYMTSYQVLKETSLPPYEAFHSELKGCNTLEADRNKYDALVKSGKSRAEALGKMHLQSPPLTGPEEYEQLLGIWQDKNMTTMADYLEYYNLLDVEPMVSALEKLQQFYSQRGICLYKECLTIAGVARLLLFRAARDAGASFSLISQGDKRLHEEIVERGITGGPSIIFHRYAESDVTRIRGSDGMMCKAVHGYDANSLYLGCLSMEQPTGPHIHRTYVDGFRARRKQNFMTAFHWLDYVAQSEAITIVHRLNHATEVVILGHHVDGYCRETHTAYDYHGCWYHGCKCVKAKKSNLKTMKWLADKRKETAAVSNTFAQDARYKYRIMWECTFTKLMKTNVKLKQFVQSREPPFFRKTGYNSVSHEQMLRAVADRTLFGVGRISVVVPNEWPMTGFRDAMSCRQFFSEFCPVFENRMVGYEHVGPTMQQHIKKHQLAEKTDRVIRRHKLQAARNNADVDRERLNADIARIKFVQPPPRRLLVSTMESSDLVVTSELIKWYIDHNLTVNIIEFLEYAPMRCFSKFVDDVTAARRAGSDVTSRAFKTLGNSAYGSIMLDMSKLNKIKYISDDEDALKNAVNDPLFRKLSQITDGLYEVDLAPKKIPIRLPYAVAINVLSSAKCHMVKFFYDFVMKFMRIECHRPILTDTDSLYIALASDNLLDIVKPEMMAEYLSLLQDHHDVDVLRPGEDGTFLPRTCCLKHNEIDMHTPFMFKMEFFGSRICCLNSKSFIATGKDVSKLSSKGLQKGKISNPWESFTEVLNTGVTRGCENVSFRKLYGGIYTYKQYRNGLNFQYYKRVVLEDGISTVPLEM